MRLNPDYGEAHYFLGRALDALGQPDQADREYQRALGFDAQ